MQNSPFTFGPVALSAVLTTNILNPPTTTGGVGAGTPNSYVILKHVRVVNKTGSAATFSLYKGLTGANTAGTEVIGTAKSIAPNDVYDWYGYMLMKTTDFLVGGSGTAAALTIQGEGEIGLVM